MSDNANNNHAAIAVLCRERSYSSRRGIKTYYDYVIAIFEGETLGDALGKFADWKLDEAVLNLDGAWRSSAKMRKHAREWFFPPVPKGFDFAAVPAQDKRDDKFYVMHFTPQQEEERSADFYYLLSYEKQLAHFVGVLKFYSQRAKQGFDLRGLRIHSPYPYLLDENWKPSDGFDEIFAYTPYFAGNNVWAAYDYVIVETAVGSAAVARLKDRHSGIDCEKIAEGLREAYAKKQYCVLNQWGEDYDLSSTCIEAKGMIFSRHEMPLPLDSSECEKYEWIMSLRLWPKDECCWPMSLECELILDRMVIESRPQKYRKGYAKWWLNHRRSQIGEEEWNSLWTNFANSNLGPEEFLGSFWESLI